MRNIGEAVGRELRATGLNWNIAPVVDTITDLTEPLDTARRFGDDAEAVAECVLDFVQGLHAGQVASCAVESLTQTLREAYRRTLGNGNENEDEDCVEVVEEELKPLRRLLENDALDSLMLSSCVHDFDDEERAGMSIRYVVDHVIRNRLQYQGPIVKNCSVLPADHPICPIHAPLHGLKSGSDMVCLARDYNTQIASIQAIYAAIEDRALPEHAVGLAYDRVQLLKIRVVSWPTTLAPEVHQVQDLQHHELLISAYTASIAQLTAGPSPLRSLPPTSVIMLLTPSVAAPDPLFPQFDPFEPLGVALSRTQPRIRHVPYTLSAGLTQTHVTFLRRAQAAILVLACASSALVDARLEVEHEVESVLAEVDAASQQPKVARILIGAGDVRDVSQGALLSKGWWAVQCWEYTRPALEAVAAVVSGDQEASGRVPLMH